MSGGKTLTIYVPVPVRVEGVTPDCLEGAVAGIQDLLSGGESRVGGLSYSFSLEAKMPSKVKIRQAYHAALRESKGES